MTTTEESRSLTGNVLLHPSFLTPHDVPAFLRAMTLRVAAGILLLSGIFVACVALTVEDDEKSKMSCSLSAATSFVAFYHYIKLISIRDQTGTRVKLAKPGNVNVDVEVDAKLTLAWQEIAADSVRYSDWLVTLMPLIVDLHIINGEHTALFPVSVSIALCSLMVVFGVFTRIGTDELVPSSTSANNDGLVRIAGLISFAISSGCLFLILFNLLHNLENDPSNGFVYAFSLPWIGYGLVTMASIIWRQLEPNGYPEALSVLKDLAFGALDTWSKAFFAFYIGSRALGTQGLMFGV